ncbi:ER membrane protein DP1/Yop1 [Entomophthora muscae]|uniref:ER membrane protein DP1/Yop1 n=1 Tax=Entomophthora muscae TaxID=34485 RepID=A0ACC2RSE7_9FUNG|nr:ER membrane protein DP1/Yop1 [Entomophthora muscae]
MDKVQYYESQLDENLSTFPILKKLEAATTVPKTYMFLGVFVVVFFSLLFDIGGSFYTNLIGWAFPAYYSFQALEEKENKDYSQWIGYWSIFGFLTFLESATEVLNYLIPFTSLSSLFSFCGFFSPAIVAPSTPIASLSVLYTPNLLLLSTTLLIPTALSLP